MILDMKDLSGSTKFGRESPSAGFFLNRLARVADTEWWASLALAQNQFRF